jgi:hypothetical protein
LNASLIGDPGMRSAAECLPRLDEKDLIPGQDWQVEIPWAVRAADLVLVCLSSQTGRGHLHCSAEVGGVFGSAAVGAVGTSFIRKDTRAVEGAAVPG